MSLEVWVPRKGIIIDFTRPLEYANRDPIISLLIEMSGKEYLFSQYAWDNEIGKESDTFAFIDHLDQAMQDNEGKSITEVIGYGMSEIQTAGQGLEKAMGIAINRSARPLIANELIENGFTIGKWINDNTVILESLNGGYVSADTRIAKFRNSVFD